MAIPIKDILDLLKKVIDLEGKIEEAIKDEKDKARRKKIAKAVCNRDLDALRKLILEP
jgi:hypothetical protein